MSASREKDPIQGEIIHEYDGILEADNHLPTWWLVTFFGAIAFALLYWMTYEAWGFADYPRAQYAEEMQRRAEEGGEVSEELLAMLSEQPEAVAEGQATYASNCLACHGPAAEGNIGPNLTDPNWIHGGSATDIYATVSDGVASAGMPPWGPVLGTRGVQAVVAYVLTLRDTNVPGREAQGEVWEPGAEAAPPEGGGGQDEEVPGADVEDADALDAEEDAEQDAQLDAEGETPSAGAEEVTEP